jgi:hypothetical protein
MDDNIKKDSRGVVGEQQLICVAQGKDQWHTLVKPVNDLCVKCQVMSRAGKQLLTPQGLCDMVFGLLGNAVTKIRLGDVLAVLTKLLR